MSIELVSPPKRPSQWQQTLRAQVLYALKALSLTVVVAVIGVCILISAQARRDEVRTADVVVVLPNATTTTGLEYAIDLYRRGYVGSLLVISDQPDALRTALIARGLPPEVIAGLITDPNAKHVWRSAALNIRERGMASVLLVDEGTSLLRDLKIANDLGLRAYGAPLPGPNPDLPQLVQAALAYWEYVLFGS